MTLSFCVPALHRITMVNLCVFVISAASFTKHPRVWKSLTRSFKCRTYCRSICWSRIENSSSPPNAVDLITSGSFSAQLFVLSWSMMTNQLRPSYRTIVCISAGKRRFKWRSSMRGTELQSCASREPVEALQMRKLESLNVLGLLKKPAIGNVL